MIMTWIEKGIGKRTIKRGFNFMKKKRISFLAMLILAVILLMPASIQAAAKPGAAKLTKSLQRITTRSASGRKHLGQQTGVVL